MRGFMLTIECTDVLLHLSDMLQVWKIFAPRFIYEGATYAAVVISTLLAVWILLAIGRGPGRQRP